MSGYAPNPTSSDDATASLTSGLLARKGQALPAVDAVAHEGVNMDYHPAPEPRSAPAPRGARPLRKTTSEKFDDNIGDSVVETLYTDDSPEPAPAPSKVDASRRAAALRRRKAARAKAQEPTVGPVLIEASADCKVSASLSPRKPALLAAPDHTCERTSPPRSHPRPNARTTSTCPRAIVKFRMPATDLVRLRSASRNMGETCQSIILDALNAYLDANDVDPVSVEAAMVETARLKRAAR